MFCGVLLFLWFLIFFGFFGAQVLSILLVFLVGGVKVFATPPFSGFSNVGSWSGFPLENPVRNA